jgi:hypothetical protein
MTKKEEQKLIDKIEKNWVNPYFHKDNPVKVFYNYNEWVGWRFYLKAIKNKDWKSIKKNLGL